MNQRAYQIAPLSFSMPVVNVVDIVVAILFGVLVFGEAPAHSPADCSSRPEVSPSRCSGCA
jgi:glucose uptake protein GlcU